MLKVWWYPKANHPTILIYSGHMFLVVSIVPLFRSKTSFFLSIQWTVHCRKVSVEVRESNRSGLIPYKPAFASKFLLVQEKQGMMIMGRITYFRWNLILLGPLRKDIDHRSSNREWSLKNKYHIYLYTITWTQFGAQLWSLFQPAPRIAWFPHLQKFCGWGQNQQLWEPHYWRVYWKVWYPCA